MLESIKPNRSCWKEGREEGVGRREGNSGYLLVSVPSPDTSRAAPFNARKEVLRIGRVAINRAERANIPLENPNAGVS
jgi:hypothetical protein